MFRLLVRVAAVCGLVVAVLLPWAGDRPAAAASTMTFTYSVASTGTIRSDLSYFAAHAQGTYEDSRGWGLGGSVRFVRVPSGGDFTLWLAQAAQVPTFGSPCSSTYSCQIGRNVIINDDRWSYGSSSLALGLNEYRAMVVNHETGHWLGFGHSTCPGAGQPAYVMQQQSKGGTYLGACVPNAWPRQSERDALARGLGVPVLTTPLGSWRDYQFLGAPRGGITSGPDVASWAPGRLDVFARGTDNALWHKWYDGGWSDWESLGGVLTSDPGVVSWGAGRLDVFVRGTDNALWHMRYENGWSGWASLGGALTSGPDVASWAPGRLDVFVQDAGNALWHKRYDGGWSEWTSLGGVLTSDPGVVSWGVGRLDVFVRGADSALWRRRFENGWSGWESLGGVLTSGPDVASWAPGRLDVFVRGTDDGMWQRSFAGGWSGWSPLGGTLTSGPGAVSWGAGRLDVFVRGTDHAIWQKSYA